MLFTECKQKSEVMSSKTSSVAICCCPKLTIKQSIHKTGEEQALERNKEALAVRTCGNILYIFYALYTLAELVLLITIQKSPDHLLLCPTKVEQQFSV